VKAKAEDKEKPVVKGWSMRAYPTPEQEAVLSAWSTAAGRFWNDMVAYWAEGMRACHPSVWSYEAARPGPRRVRSPWKTADKYPKTGKNAGGVTLGVPLFFALSGKPFSDLVSDAIPVWTRPDFAASIPSKMLHGVGADFDQAVGLWKTNQDATGKVNAWRSTRAKKGQAQLPQWKFGAPSFQKESERGNLRWQYQGAFPVKRVSKRRGEMVVCGFRDAKLGTLKVAVDNGLPWDGQVKSIRIRRDNLGLWWVGLSLSLDPAIVQAFRPARFPAVGLDRGVTTPVMASRGYSLRKIPPLTPGQEARKRRLERSIARQHLAFSPECFGGGSCNGRCGFWNPVFERVRDENGRKILASKPTVTTRHHSDCRLATAAGIRSQGARKRAVAQARVEGCHSLCVSVSAGSVLMHPSRSMRFNQRGVAILAAKQARRRKNAQHVFTRRVVDSSAMIFMEGLNTKGMTKSSAGSAETPGKNVAQKTGLNKAILNVGWYEIERQLGYKGKWAGRHVAKVVAAYSSQECAECGYVDKANRRGKRFVCLACGSRKDADFNASQVVERRGTGARPLASSRTGEVAVDELQKTLLTSEPRRTDEAAINRVESATACHPEGIQQKSSTTRKATDKVTVDGNPAEDLSKATFRGDSCERSDSTPNPGERSQGSDQGKRNNSGVKASPNGRPVLSAKERSQTTAKALVNGSVSVEPSQ
jgi:hypothetical protein